MAHLNQELHSPVLSHNVIQLFSKSTLKEKTSLCVHISALAQSNEQTLSAQLSASYIRCPGMYSLLWVMVVTAKYQCSNHILPLKDVTKAPIGQTAQILGFL